MRTQNHLAIKKECRESISALMAKHGLQYRNTTIDHLRRLEDFARKRH